MGTLASIQALQAATGTDSPMVRSSRSHLSIRNENTSHHSWQTFHSVTSRRMPAGVPASTLFVSGGVTRSEVWLQMHADVTGLPVQVGQCAHAPLLGAAILAAASAGIHSDVTAATAAMVHPALLLEPRYELVGAIASVRHSTAFLKPQNPRFLVTPCAACLTNQIVIQHMIL